MEKTYLEEIYDYFLSSISDYAILESIHANPSEVEDDLFTYCKIARGKCDKCKQPRDLKEDLDGRKYFAYIDDKTGKEVDVRLVDFEIAILTHLMLVEYMKPQLIATEVMKQSLSDKDFKIYSQATQLRELNLLYRLIQRESKVMITEYTYMGMVDDDRKQWKIISLLWLPHK